MPNQLDIRLLKMLIFLIFDTPWSWHSFILR